MMGRGRAIISVPLPPEYRASGVLLHITSLPSRHGIGDLGPSARAWIDRLADAGQSWWQSLPLGPRDTATRPTSRFPPLPETSCWSVPMI